MTRPPISFPFVRKIGAPIYLSGPAPFRRDGESPMVQAYCVKCRAKREMAEPKKVKLKNGKPAMKGKCPKCGTTLFRIGAA